MSGSDVAALQQLVLTSFGFAVKSDWLDAMLPQLQTADGGAFLRMSPDQQLQAILEQLLVADFRAAGAGGHLPASIKDLHKQTLQGKYMLQLDETVNIAAGFKERYRDQGPGRCLKLHLTDGVQDITAMEYRFISALAVLMPAGLKLLIVNPEVRRGMLLLQAENVVVLGGVVDRLEAARQALLQHVNKPADHCAERRTSEQVYQQAAAAAWANASQFQQQQQQQQQAEAQANPATAAAADQPDAGQQQPPQPPPQAQQPVQQPEQQQVGQQWSQPQQQQQWQRPVQQQGNPPPVQQQQQQGWQQQHQGPAAHDNANSWRTPDSQQQQPQWQQQQQQQQPGLMLPPLHPRRTPQGVGNVPAHLQQQQQHVGAATAVPSGADAGFSEHWNSPASSSAAAAAAGGGGGGGVGVNDANMDHVVDDFDNLDDISDYMLDDIAQQYQQQRQQQNVDVEQLPGSTAAGDPSGIPGKSSMLQDYDMDDAADFAGAASHHMQGHQDQQHQQQHGVDMHARSASRAAAAAAAAVADADISSDDDDVGLLDSQHDGVQPGAPGTRLLQQRQKQSLLDNAAEALAELTQSPDRRNGGNNADGNEDSDIDLDRALDKQLEQFQVKQKKARTGSGACLDNSDRLDVGMTDTLQQQQHREDERMDWEQDEQQQQRHRRPVLQRRRRGAQLRADSDKEDGDTGWGATPEQQQRRRQQQEQYSSLAAAAEAGLENQAPCTANSKPAAAAGSSAGSGGTNTCSKRVLSVSQHKRDIHMSQQQQGLQQQQQQLVEPWKPQRPSLLGPKASGTAAAAIQQRQQQGQWQPEGDSDRQSDSPSTVPSPPLTEPSLQGFRQQPAPGQTSATAVAAAAAGGSHASVSVAAAAVTPAAALAGVQQQGVETGQGSKAQVSRGQGSSVAGSSGLCGSSRRGSGTTLNPLAFEKSDPLKGRRSSVSISTAGAAGVAAGAAAVVTPGVGSSAAAVTPAVAVTVAGAAVDGTSTKPSGKPSMDALFNGLLQALDGDGDEDLCLPALPVSAAAAPAAIHGQPAAAAPIRSGVNSSSSNGFTKPSGLTAAVAQQQKSAGGASARKQGGSSGGGSGSSKLSAGSGGKRAGSDIRAVFARANEFAAAGALPLKSSAAGVSRNGGQQVQKGGLARTSRPAAAAVAAGPGVIVLDDNDDIGQQIEHMDDDDW